MEACTGDDPAAAGWSSRPRVHSEDVACNQRVRGDPDRNKDDVVVAQPSAVARVHRDTRCVFTDVDDGRDSSRERRGKQDVVNRRSHSTMLLQPNKCVTRTKARRQSVDCAQVKRCAEKSFQSTTSRELVWQTDVRPSVSRFWREVHIEVATHSDVPRRPECQSLAGHKLEEFVPFKSSSTGARRKAIHVADVQSVTRAVTNQRHPQGPSASTIFQRVGRHCTSHLKQ